MFIKKLNSRGDTIVEVMIVLAVLGFALGLAYTTANRALLNTRQAQESAEATRLAQTQIERLRALAPKNFSDNIDPHDQYNIYLSRDPFCIDEGPFSPYTIYDVDSGNISPPSGPAPATNPCKNIGKSNLYTQQITYSDTGTDRTFTVLVSWDNVRGDGIDTVQMSYRVYPSGQL